MMLDLLERSPISGEPLSVILLAHNDQGHLESVVKNWVSFLEGRGISFEILLVDEGSTDQTRSLGETLAGWDSRIRLFQQPVWRGLGAALRTGLNASSFPLVFYTTVDEQYQTADLSLLFEWIDKVDLVGGYRDRTHMPLRSRWAESLLRWLMRLLIAVRLRDVNCWFVLARRSVFARIVLQSAGLFAQAEVLAKANHLGWIMTEVPISYRPRSEIDLLGNRAEWRRMWREGYAVLSNPDFGPPFFLEAPTSLPKQSPTSRIE